MNKTSLSSDRRAEVPDRRVVVSSRYFREPSLVSSFLHSTGDVVVIVLPVLVLMILGVCDVDERLSSPKKSYSSHRSFCGVDENNRSCITDPDGRPWVGSHAQIGRTRRERAQGIGAQSIQIIAPSKPHTH